MEGGGEIGGWRGAAAVVLLRRKKKKKLIVSARGLRVNFSNCDVVVLISGKKQTSRKMENSL